jgi:hypothetical protein
MKEYINTILYRKYTANIHKMSLIERIKTYILYKKHIKRLYSINKVKNKCTF